jgi:hypothetical protein
LKPKPVVEEKPFLPLSRKQSSFKLKANAPSLLRQASIRSATAAGSYKEPVLIPGLERDVSETSSYVSFQSQFRYRANSDPSCDTGHLNIEEELNIIPRRPSAYRRERGPSDLSDYEDMSFSYSPYEESMILHIMTPPAPSAMPDQPMLKAVASLTQQVEMGGENSSILSNKDILHLVRHLPLGIQNDGWVLLYTVLRHGSDMAAFYQRVAGYKYSLVVVRTMDGQVFGGFGSEAWKMQRVHMFYGSGESFLFKKTGENDK